MILIPISNGELIDKLTILDIKMRKLKDPASSELEYDLLLPYMDTIGLTTDSEEYKELLKINEKIWDLEEEIRGQFYEACDFYSCASNIYETNDLRAKVKKKINLSTRSQLVEQKSYAWFTND